MESVGQKLRGARTRLGLTLEQVSAATRITLKNLTAIESDDLPRISSPFHYRSFVRQFADCVKLDYGSIAADVQSAAGSMPEPRMPGQEDTPVIHVKRIRPKRQWKLNWLRSLVSFSIVMVVCTGMYTTWRNSRGNFGVMVGKIGAELQGVKARLNPVQPVVRTQPRHIAAASKPAADIEEGPVKETGFHIQLAALEKTWLSIVADGKEVFSGVLDATQTKVLQGRESARIRTGNLGGVAFTFNGKEIGVLGPRGQVRTVIFTKDNYEVLPAVPEVALSSFIQSAE